MTQYETEDDSGDGEEHECPWDGCGYTTDTERGVKVHHKRVHGESIAGVEVECDHCGKAKTVVPDRVDRYDKHFCNNQCRSEASRKRTDAKCHWCGDTFEIAEWHLAQSGRVFCPDKQCRGDWISATNHGSDHPRYRGDIQREAECANCGTVVEKDPHEIENNKNCFCSPECHHEWLRTDGPRGEEHPLYSQIEVPCAYCGEHKPRKRHFIENYDKQFCDSACHGKWISENLTGENNPNWEGGSVSYYGENWPQQRALAVERDSHTCQLCGCTEEEWREDKLIGLDVHHIRPIDSFDSPERANALENLITLCRPCHRQAEMMAPLLPPGTKQPAGD